MLPPALARLARLVRRSSRLPPLDCAETCELNEALCGEACWVLAAEMYGVGPALRDHPGDPVGAALAARPFGGLVAANPHVADWFLVFAPRPGVKRELAEALAGAMPAAAARLAGREVLYGRQDAPRAKGAASEGERPPDAAAVEDGAVDGGADSAERSREFVACAAIACAAAAFSRTRSLLEFLGVPFGAPEGGDAGGAPGGALGVVSSARVRASCVS